MAIDIAINAGLTREDSSITATGFMRENLNDNDKNRLFGTSVITNDAALFNFLRRDLITGPAVLVDYKDVYKEVVPIKAEILTISSEPIIVKTQEFANNSDIPGTFNVQINDTVQDSSTNSWNIGGSFTFTQKISYGIGFLTKGGGETSLSYTQSWGEANTHAVSYTVGSSSGVSIIIAPNKSIKASLSATRGKLKTRITYNTKISGTVRFFSPNAPITREGQWRSYDINKLLATLNRPTPSITTEDVDVGYYSSSKVTIDKGAGLEQVFTF